MGAKVEIRLARKPILFTVVGGRSELNLVSCHQLWGLTFLRRSCPADSDVISRFNEPDQWLKENHCVEGFMCRSVETMGLTGVQLPAQPL